MPGQSPGGDCRSQFSMYLLPRLYGCCFSFFCCAVLPMLLFFMLNDYASIPYRWCCSAYDPLRFRSFLAYVYGLGLLLAVPGLASSLVSRSLPRLASSGMSGWLRGRLAQQLMLDTRIDQHRHSPSPPPIADLSFVSLPSLHSTPPYLQVTRKLCKELNERFLCPMESDALEITLTNSQVGSQVTCFLKNISCKRFVSFPATLPWAYRVNARPSRAFAAASADEAKSGVVVRR